MSRSPACAKAQSQKFDFTFHMRRVCADMCLRLPELRHIDAHRVAVAMRRTRKRVSYGLQASLTPLRFEGGRLETELSGRKWTIQRFYNGLRVGIREFLAHPRELRSLARKYES